jgi:chemotaxis signal transduction protein
MKTMVHFESGGTAYCLPVDAARGVRPATGLVRLPAPGTDVAGIVPGDPPLTVIAPLGGGGNQVLVVESLGKTFGLLVDSVTGLRRVADAEIRTAPDGQERALVCGTITNGEELVMVTDPAALAGRL